VNLSGDQDVLATLAGNEKFLEALFSLIVVSVLLMAMK
jgi:hypothetical protein